MSRLSRHTIALPHNGEPLTLMARSREDAAQVAEVVSLTLDTSNADARNPEGALCLRFIDMASGEGRVQRIAALYVALKELACADPIAELARRLRKHGDDDEKTLTLQTLAEIDRQEAALMEADGTTEEAP